MRTIKNSRIDIGKVNEETKMYAAKYLFENYVKPLMEYEIRDLEEQGKEEKEQQYAHWYHHH